MLIGFLQVPSPQSKIKDNVDHVGLSHPPVLWKDSAKSDSDHFKTSHNNNSLIVQAHMETKVATEV